MTAITVLSLTMVFSTTVGKLWLMRSSKITVRTEAAL